MFILKDNWLTPDSTHVIFDFHLPGYPVVPGAISAGRIHQTYCEEFNNADSDIDIVFQQPITSDARLKLSISSNLSELIDSNGKTSVRLLPTTSIKKPNIILLSNFKKLASRITRPPELIFHHEFISNENLAECSIHYENLLLSRPYLSSLKYASYFIVLETMGNLAMELCAINTQEVFLFHSFKGVWFDWLSITGEITITTSARRINTRIIQWSSQVKNKNHELVGYVNMGLNILNLPTRSIMF